MDIAVQVGSEKIVEATSLNFIPQLPSGAANVKKVARCAVN